MSTREQQTLMEKYYGKATRYMDNAKECLKKAKKEDNYYLDSKYVKMACGTAYNGVLLALDCILTLKGIEAPRGKKRKSIEYYHENISKIDKKILNAFNSTYEILHLWGYYDGITNVKVVKTGFDEAYKIIDKIKPSLS